MLEPVLDLDRLVATPRFTRVACELGDEFVDAYLAATGEADPAYGRDGLVPPLATSLVRFTKASLGGRWPTGTLQISEQMRCHRALRRGEALAITVAPIQAPPPGGDARVAIATRVHDADGALVAEHLMRSLWGGRPAGARAGPSAARPPAAASATSGHAAAFGRRIGPLADTFPMSRVRAYADVAGAHDPVHVDPAFAAASPIGANIVQGKLVMTLVSRLLLTEFGRRWLEGGGFELRLRRPVAVGESVAAWAQALDGTPDTFRVWCENARGETVIEGTASLAAG